MYQMGGYSFQIPVFFWNPSLIEYQPIYSQVSVPLNTQIQGEQASQRVEENSISNEEINVQNILKLITPKLKSIHRKSMNHKKTHWSLKQDELLEKLVQKQKLQWKQIPKYFQNRTLNMCYSRYRRILSNAKEGWSKQDDQLIINMVNRFGEKWKQISLEVPRFSPKQIRQRYLNCLRPNIDKSEFTLEEDLKICQLVLKQGKHWRKFEQMLPGRAEGAIKSRYYSKLKNLIQSP